MSQHSQRQRQQLQQSLKHKTKPQQVLEARLLEMSAERAKERVEEELYLNPYLSAEPPAQSETPREEKREAEPAPSGDDEPVAPQSPYEGPERQIAATETLYEHLTRQLADYDVSPRQRSLITYLIGCIDGDGKLDASLPQIADDLYINKDIDATEAELEEALARLQQFDPAGIGGRSTQECLLLQARRLSSEQKRRVFTTLFSPRYYDDFTHQRWSNIQASARLSEADMALIRREVKRFDPYPARSYGATQHADYIKPDFEVAIEQGHIELTLLEGDLPRLTLDKAELDAAAALARDSGQGGAERVYRGYAESGRMFVEALRQRRATMLATMKAIVALQRDFFLTGDETRLRPMMLEDVAARTGQDISTASRAARGKYVRTPYGTYPLKWFFTQKAKTQEQDISVRQVLAALHQLIDHEPPSAPLSDEALSQALKRQGYEVARRTVVKYRSQLGIPIASIRRRAR